MQTRESDVPQAERVSAIFVRHPLWEDALALLTGTALVALGIAFYSHAGLLTGGTVGLAFLLKYLAGWSFGPVFFLLNLPFYALAIWRMGWKFTLRTVCAVGLVSLFAELTPQWVRFAWHETAEPNLMNVEGLPANSFVVKVVGTLRVP